MKYKLIIIFFNFFMFISFLSVFLLPLSVLGFDYARDFWLLNWYLPVIFCTLVVIFNIFFFSNWSILKYVEKEDWESLKPVLEDRIYNRRKIRYTSVKLLINSYYLTSDIESLFILEEFLEKNSSSLHKKSQLMFISGRLLKEEFSDVEKYLESKLNKFSGYTADWIMFDYCFILVLQKKFDKALEYLKTLINRTQNKLIKLCTVYLLYISSGTGAPDEPEKLRADFIAVNSREKFIRIVEKEKGELHVLFFTKIINQAVEWGYAARNQ